jgi:cell division control protein 45
MHLHRAILRTGTAILSKNQIRHLRAFRMGIVRDGPDVQLFTHPGALTKLALWVGEAIAEQERDHGRKPTPLVLASLNERRGVYVVVGTGGRGLDLGLRDKEREERKKRNEKKKEEKRLQREKRQEEKRAAKEARRKAAAENGDNDEDEGEEDETEEELSSSDSESDDEEDIDFENRKSRFGNSFQEVVEETNARVRMESFDHCVIEVKKDDLGMFLEALSSKSVMN